MALNFNRAQTFYIDAGVVGNAPKVLISAVDLFFQAKPDRVNNLSGINSPGVNICLCETIYGVPNIQSDLTQTIARAEYDQIATTSDASLATRFRFKNLVHLDTSKEYAVLIMFDGSDNFQLWTNRIGDFLIDTKKISPGASGKYIGKYYDFVNTPQSAGFVLEAGGVGPKPIDDFQSHWTSLPDVDLKFRIYCARFASNGFAVSSNTSIPTNVQVIRSQVPTDPNANNEVYLYPSSCMEMLIFDQSQSVKERFVGGQWAYQNTFSYPGGWANGSSSIKVAITGNDRVSANTNYPNGQAFSWRDIYPNIGASQSNDSPYIVLKTDTGVNVRRVTSVVSNTVIQLDEPTTFVNAAAEFMLTPVGLVDSFNKSSPFGHFESIIVLTQSSANATLRFVNNAIANASIVAGGASYSNSDVLYVTGYESISGVVTGGYKAVANIVTFGNGTIQGVYFSNLGCGFVNSASMNVVITAGANNNPTTNTTAGSGANIALNVGTSVRTELRNNSFNDCVVANFPLSDIIPYFDIDAPEGTSYDLKIKAQYYLTVDTQASVGYAYFVNDNDPKLTFPLIMFQKNQFMGDRIPAMMSRSNEFITKYSNGASNDRVGVNGTSNTLVMYVNTASNSDFTCVSINSIPTFSLASYLVNNDYSGENTDQGNAWARHITTKINFGRPSEDLLVYLTAYNPANTDIEVYARIYNSTDSEYFEDKDWTRLQQNFTANLVSSSTDTNDWVELTYGLQQYPNTDIHLDGTITGANNSANIVGVGTHFSTNLVAGDLVKISNPLFANTYMIDIVNSVANDTLFTIHSPISNINFATSGLVVDRIRTYKHQAFNYLLNDNVARYYTSSMVQIDTYDTVQIKVVMLSDRPNLIPRVDDIRFVGVSA